MEKSTVFLFFDGVISDARFSTYVPLRLKPAILTGRGSLSKNEAFCPEAAKPDGYPGRATVSFAQEDYPAPYHQLNEGVQSSRQYTNCRVRSLYVRCLLGMHLAELRHEAPLHSA